MLAWGNHQVEFDDERRERDEIERRLADVDITQVEQRWIEASGSALRARIVENTTTKQNANRMSAIGTQPGGGPGFANAVCNSFTALRGWACTALSLKQNFRLEAGLFDHVIIDEASQCTLAALLPAAYRARRLTLVGDPHQLNPIIQLGRAQVRDIAKSSGLDPDELDDAGLDYRSGSAFDAFASAVGSDDIQLLDEHFRCHPLVARWFNTTFYGGRLTVLTDIAQWPPGQRGLHWIDTFGEAERPADSSTINRREAATITEHLADLLGTDASIGVVTPFSGQVRLIERMVRKRYPADVLGEARFTVGTAHRFQGDERDVILFSTVVAPGIRPRTAEWVEHQRNLLNVAASRARRALVVFGHPTAARDNDVPTLASLRTAALEGPATAGASWALHSEAESRLNDAMHRAGLAPVLKPNEQGFELDFAIVTPSVRLNIEVDGSQHLDERGRQRRQDLARDRVLAGVGWDVVRYPAWRCMSEPDAVANEIVAELASSSLGKW